ncbi:hypothetical protein Q1695_011609 [Nippostrongylus brasiliensis]|nr:hypothetical protein Q1695_011609 [Nippostrongylus brasiliensis]
MVLLSASRAVPSSSAVKSRACAQTSDTHTLPRAPTTGGSHFEPDVKPARHSAFRPSVTGKRVTRRQPASNILPLPGIRPAPAVPIRRDNAPADFRSRFEDMHPWGCHLVDRPHFGPLSDDTVTSYLDAFVYKHVSQNGYFAARFVRSLFPRQFVGTPSVENPVPLPEVVRFVDTIAMRRQSAQVIEDLRNDTYVEDHLDVPRGPTGPPASCLFPPEYKGVRPVLYQVVYKGYGQGLILEAKDFLLFCPDRIELQCIVLDQYAVNTLSETTGFDREHVSIKDFVWVYAVGPTPRARAEPSEVLEGARRMRPTAFDVTTPFYFRATKYTFVTPPKDDRATLGIVLNGYREAVTVSPKLCDFPIATAEPDQWLFGDMRHNSSTASRFSAAPVSKATQSYLVNAIRVVLPAFPYETMTPLRVYRLSPAEEDWIRDRGGVFRNYANDPREARRRMGKLFSASCAALSCTKLLNDDKTTRLVDASVPSLSSFPIRLVFELPNASADMGWNAHRPVDLWVVDSNTVLRMVIAQASYRFETRTLHVTLHTTISCHEHMRNLIDRFGRLQQRAVRVSACVRLGRLPIRTDPLFELLAEEEVFGTFHPSRDCRANAILNRLYDHRQAGADPDVPVPAQAPPAPMSVRLDNVPIDLRADQIHAVQMGDIDTPILAIQAAFGTGKTVVGALIAARLATAYPEAIIVAMATTNGAIPRCLTVVRRPQSISITSSDGCRETTATNLVRRSFIPAKITPPVASLAEIALFHPEQTMYLTEDQREDYRIAERENPEATEEAVEIMFRVRRPNILCITSASLLNSAGSLGLFGPHTKDCSVIIGDEASQIPEPVLVATSSWFPNARLIFIGDVHQLSPHIRTSPESVAARHGARGIMDLLLAKQVPVAPLLATFRAHPALKKP